MTPTELEHTGRTLYGDAWKTQLAHALGVTRHSIQIWASGRRPMPGHWDMKIALLCQRRARTMQQLGEDIEEQWRQDNG